MSRITDTFTQGGQIQLHKFRMLYQVSGATLKISLLCSLIFFLVFLLWNHSLEYYAFLIVHYKAILREKMSFLPDGCFDSSWVCHHGGNWLEVNDYVLAKHPTYLRYCTIVEAFLLKASFYTLLFFIASFISICAFWLWRGKAKKRKEILSGSQELPMQDVIEIMRQKKACSDIYLDQMPLVKDSETKHILLVGTTGSGKTNTFNHLLPQIRKRQQKAVIVDTTGVFVEKFYDPKTDIILNPLDARSANWDIWQECQTDIQTDEIASSLIPQALHDPFWADSARSLFVETLKKLKEREKPLIKTLLDLAINQPLKDIQSFYTDTSVASIVDIAADKTAASIRVNLATYIRCLSLIEDQGETPFSIRQWIKDEQKTGWLFLTAMPDQRETLRPLITTWLNTAINSMMSLRPDSERRVWFIIDEKPSLDKVEALPKALAEIRKYGGCIVAGLQNISQIDKLYGHEIRKTMSSLYNTKLFFRSPDSDTAQWISKTIGDQEVMENSEGISFGAHQMRDGVSLNEQKKNKAVIGYTEFMSLPDLTAYIKLPEDYPITKISFSFKHLETKNTAFVIKEKGMKEEKISLI